MRRSLKKWELNSKGIYLLNTRERIYIYVKSAGGIMVFAYFFYRSIWAVVILIPVFVYFVKKEKENKVGGKKEELKQQFKEMIVVIAGNLKAGYSVENAFIGAEEDMKQQYGAHSIINQIIKFIKNGMQNNIPLERQLAAIGEKSGIEEIKEFADVFEIVKSGGGNMVHIMEETSLLISRKLETEKEIQVLLSARKLEQKIMNGIPFFFLIYLEITSPGFFEVLYHNITGILFMSVCLLMYLTAYQMSAKIVSIQV